VLFGSSCQYRYLPQILKREKINYMKGECIQKRKERRENARMKAMPLQAWTDSEGSRRMRLPDFNTNGTCRW
jgi:hypothetical protein